MHDADAAAVQPTHRAVGRSPRWLAWTGLSLALLPCAGFLAVELYLLGGHLGLPLDDGWIHLQFARNLASGHGLAYNPDHRVAGSTAPLWTALLSIGLLVRLPAVAWAQALGVAAQLLTVAGSWRLARALTLPRPLAALAAGLVATSGPLVWGALSGMEIPAFTALSVWAMAYHARERVALSPGTPAPLSLLLLGLAVLLRPEGLLLLALALGDRLLVLRREGDELRLTCPPWRSLLTGALLAGLLVLPVVLVYQALGGSPLPTTFDTKAGYSTPGLPRAQYLFGVLGLLAAAQPVAALLAPAGALALLARLGGDADRGLLPALWAGGLPLAYGVLSGTGRGILGNFGRYFFPLLPVVAVLAVLAVAPLLGRLPPRLRWGPLVVAWPLWLGALLLLPGLASLLAGAGRYAQNLRDVEAGDVRLAHLLALRLDARASLAVDDIGALKYLLPNPVVDLAGIVTPEVHAYAHRALAATGSYCPGLLAFVRDRRPDYLAIFPRRHECFDDSEFPPLLRLEVPDNITLGEDTIVLHATPWTRYPLGPAPPSGSAAASRP
ncbi:MAG TPA: hypothetical protein VGV61_13450 [Thermoanaerobaculia bacterium]|jgi:hypothetical protein|nr:hypothetical protein [Thermoanaerobaculia bacterium]